MENKNILVVEQRLAQYKEKTDKGFKQLHLVMAFFFIMTAIECFAITILIWK